MLVSLNDTFRQMLMADSRISCGYMRQFYLANYTLAFLGKVAFYKIMYMCNLFCGDKFHLRVIL